MVISIYEKDIVSYFKTNIKEIFKESKVVNVHCDINNKVDMWVETKGFLFPIEFKRGDIGNVALGQLKRYMEFYGCEFGFLVGRKIKCSLPKNIGFISYLEYIW